MRFFAVAIVAGVVFQALPSQTGAGERVPVVYSTDLFHPHDDFDDHIDLATLFALPELDVKAIILEKGDEQAKRPGKFPVEQMFALTGRRVPYASGLMPLKSASDTGRDQPAADQKGVELLLNVLRESDKPVAILTLGSVRDVVAAFNREPELVRKRTAGIYMNIGNSQVGGGEWNVGLDVEAFRGLLRTDLPIWWFPCHPVKGIATTYWEIPKMGDTFSGAPTSLKCYFTYALRKSNPSQLDSIAALQGDGADADGLFNKPKDMWSLVSMLHLAGRRIHRVDGRYTCAATAPPGATETNLYHFLPVHTAIDAKGKTAAFEYVREGATLRVIQVPDPNAYSQAMNDCLRELLSQFPIAAKSEPLIDKR
jgi:hypothetical protein